MFQRLPWLCRGQAAILNEVLMAQKGMLLMMNSGLAPLVNLLAKSSRRQTCKVPFIADAYLSAVQGGSRRFSLFMPLQGHSTEEIQSSELISGSSVFSRKGRGAWQPLCTD